MSTSKQRKQIVNGLSIISTWLILLVIPAFYRAFKAGTDIILSPVATLEMTYYIFAVVCAFGLLGLKQWARKLTVFLFSIQLAAILYAIYFLIQPSWQQIIEWQSYEHNLSAEIVKYIIMGIIAMYIIWQIIVILFLLHPKVAIYFKDPTKEFVSNSK